MIEFGALTKDEAIRGLMRIGTLSRSCYGQETVQYWTPPTLSLRPSIHPSGLLQWQAGEFDGQAERTVEAERPRPCARYPQDCAGEDWVPGEWESCPYMKSQGRKACGWKAEG